MTYFGMVTTKKSEEYTVPALESFFKYTELCDGDQFFLIDNDQTFEHGDKFPKITIIKPEAPRGFAANVNDIIQRALQDRQHMAFLNNDLIFTPKWWQPLSLHDDKVTLPTCNQNFQYKVGDYLIPVSLKYSDFKGYEEHLIAAAEHHRERMKSGVLFDELRANFFCFRVPLPVLEKVGYFDETYGTGGAEDCDYNLRLKLAGVPVVFVGESYILHFVGKSTWLGGETIEQLRDRHDKYFKRFTEKWGGDLADIFVTGGNMEAVLERLQLIEAYQTRDYEKIIKKCLIRRIL